MTKTFCLPHKYWAFMHLLINVNKSISIRIQKTKLMQKPKNDFSNVKKSVFVVFPKYDFCSYCFNYLNSASLWCFKSVNFAARFSKNNFQHD